MVIKQNFSSCSFKRVMDAILGGSEPFASHVQKHLHLLQSVNIPFQCHYLVFHVLMLNFSFTFIKLRAL